MVTKDHADKLSRALQSSGIAQPVQATHGENRISVMCRVPKDNEEKWIKLVERILMAADDESGELHAWQTHICRNYFLKEFDGGVRKLVWGWNVSIHSKEMGASLNMVIKLVHGEPIRTVSNKELSEFPLHGASNDRNAPKKGRGVHTIGDGDFHPAKSK